ncbi:MAG: TRC40/GET3/ArsA family transport-energizing ATPase [Deltaproteobacteria bacterium]|jgi:arsenite-transporting ATPase
MRIIFFAGKGGVGKTSVAAATGITSAEAGNRTVIMSLDVAHSLSDIFDLNKDLIGKQKGKRVKIQENLWIQELDIQEEIEKNWGDIHKYLSTLLNTTGLDEILAEELAILPGMEEVSLLLYINHYVRTQKFDVILLDCAPTGESLRFISIPTALEWYIKKIFKMERTIARYARPVAKRFYDVPLPGEDYFDAIEHLFERLKGVDHVLADPDITTVRLITNPEKIVLKETQRAFMYFSLYRMTIDGIIMNRVLPKDVNDTYFKGWRKAQAQYMKKAREYFSPIPIFPADLFRGEILGIEPLKVLAEQIYKGEDPLSRFYDGETYQISKSNGHYRLQITLPFAAREDVQINKVGEEIIIRIAGFKKHILLPRPVAARDSIRAKLEGKQLNIYFEGGDDEQGKE